MEIAEGRVRKLSDTGDVLQATPRVCAPKRVSVFFSRYMCQPNKIYDLHYKACLAFISEHHNDNTTPSAESGVHSRSICFMLSAVVMVAHFEAYFKI